MEDYKVLFLTNNDNSMDLFDWLKERVRVKIFKELLVIIIAILYL